MPRNVGTLLVTAMLFGLSAAVYDTALPVYLDRVGMSPRSMGWIYFVPALLAVVAPIIIGVWSDRIGRKVIFAFVLVAQGIATLLTPLFSGKWMQLAVKCLRDPCFQSREALHSVMLQDAAPRRFLTYFGKTRGAEFLMQFVGLFNSFSEPL